MNFEELLESRNGAALAKEKMPFGLFYKKMTDGKYANVVDFREDLLDSLVFADALATEAGQNSELNHPGQLHFTLASDSAGLYGVKVEQGSYRTLERLLDETPSVVAGKNFIENTLKSLLELTSFLHDKGIYHICYAPSNVLMRKSDNAPLLLMHGSAYKAYNDQEALYGDSTAYVAPEVLEEGTFDARADIYSIGKLMEYLYHQSEVPVELRGVIAKATDADPDRRYQTPEAMQRAIASRQQLRRSVLGLLGGLAAALIAVGLYISLTPEPEDIEFVKPVQEEQADYTTDEGFDPMTELGPPIDTSATHVDSRKLKEYEAKAEQIFRKNFTREATRILSRIYTNEHMNATEKNFMAGNQSTMEELVRAQVKLGSDAGLSDARSQLIGGQVIEQVTGKLKAEMARQEKASKDQEPAKPKSNQTETNE